MHSSEFLYGAFKDRFIKTRYASKSIKRGQLLKLIKAERNLIDHSDYT